MKSLKKKTLGIFSLTCCEGCQFALLSDYDDFSYLTHLYDLKNFRLGQEDNLPGPFDVALVEGTPESKREIKLLREIRKQAKTVIVLGTCAHMGGIQSERNQLPKSYIKKDRVKTVTDVIRAEYLIPGCPISHKESIKILVNLYWDNTSPLPDYGVCFECRQNENECLLKQKKACLGPITRGGCDSVCVNGGEACLGCRGPLDQADFRKIKEVLKPILSEKDTINWLTIYGDMEKIHINQITNFNE